MAKAQQSGSGLHNVLQWLVGREREMVACVRELVVRESPTHNKLSCDELSSYLGVEFERLDGRFAVSITGVFHRDECEAVVRVSQVHKVRQSTKQSE